VRRSEEAAMFRSLRSRWMLGGSFVVSLAVASCGSQEGSEFDGDGGKNTNPGPNNGDGGFNTGPTGTNDACVSAVKGAELTPVNLVIMYDKSGSMGNPAENASFDPNKRWIPVGAALKAFATDPSSTGISASLTFFPLDGDITVACGGDYKTPRVPMTPLASGGGTAIVNAIDTTTPSGGTPTLPALQGAIAYAKEIAGKRPGERTVVVLQSDGYPGLLVNGTFQAGCPNNDIPSIAAAADAAYKGSPSIPTYVIGVDTALTDLNTIAAAGGTKQAFMVAVGDPNATKAAFAAALASIRTFEVSCDFALPPPPDGKELNKNGVNVVLKDAQNQETVLAYNSDCNGGSGWHYDNLANPQRVILCPASCEQTRRDSGAKVSLAFGCLTKGIVR
jgi:hypothetical protein